MGSPNDGCLKGTREAFFQTFDSWLIDFDAPNIFWIKGFPGVGKSAIASTLVEKLRLNHRYGSSFFFKRAQATLATPNALWAKVAYDLSKVHPTVKKAVVGKLEEGIVAFSTSSVAAIFHHLVEEPLSLCSDSDLPIGRLPVVVVDGLDECGGFDNVQSQVTLLQSLKLWSTLSKKFKIVVTSRDDYIINNTLANISYCIHLTSGKDVVTEAADDIRMYFQEHFFQISSQFPKSLSSAWPGSDILDILVARAAGLFVWAKTVIDFVRITEPEGQLQQIMTGEIGVGDITALYIQILAISFKNARGDVLKAFKDVVGTIILAKQPLTRTDFMHLLHIKPTMLDTICNGLQSVIDFEHTFTFKHQSFADFLLDSKKCPTKFLMNMGQLQRCLIFATLDSMISNLSFNICKLGTSYTQNNDIANLGELVNLWIPSHLSYSCLFWAQHICEATFDLEVVEKVEQFLKRAFLFWLEVLSLLGSVDIAIPSLKLIIAWMKACYIFCQAGDFYTNIPL